MARHRDPRQRLERALDELYAYYERTAPMFSNVLRDAELVDLADEGIAPLLRLPRAGRRGPDRRAQGPRPQTRAVGGALRHALAFPTWRSLSANGIARSDAVALTTALVEGAATPAGRGALGGGPRARQDNPSGAAAPATRQGALTRWKMISSTGSPVWLVSVSRMTFLSIAS